MVLDHKILIEHYGAREYNEIMRAFRTLQGHAFFELAISMEKMAVLDSFDLNPDSLAKKIIDMQQTTRLLMTLNELAGQLKERTNNES